MEHNKHIRLGHGSGGKLTHDLVTGLFLKYFDNEILAQQGDSGLFPLDGGRIPGESGQTGQGSGDGTPSGDTEPGSRERTPSGDTGPGSRERTPSGGTGRMAFSTDAYVVDPIFFPGGNIGSLAVSGTVNDVAVTGADPRYLSAAFILEEGLPVSHLEEIVREMAAVAREAGVRIIAGDTKVVNKGKCDKVFITTAGVGFLEDRFAHIAGGERVKPGDRILINGYAGDHGIAILGERESLKFTSPVLSDAACLNGLIRDVIENHEVHFMRDATRGGVATVLAEMASLPKGKYEDSKDGMLKKNGLKKNGILVEETAIPIREEVRGICEVFGYDPLYMANEGKVVMVVPDEEAEAVLSRMKNHPLGKDSAIIGRVTSEHAGKVILQTEIGGRRFLDMLAGEQLPRIC